MSLSVEHVSVSLDGRDVLNDIDFEVATGRVLAVRGRSGIGKSTLLRVIAGLIRPDTGRIIVDHIDVTDVPTHRRSIIESPSGSIESSSTIELHRMSPRSREARLVELLWPERWPPNPSLSSSTNPSPASTPNYGNP